MRIQKTRTVEWKTTMKVDDLDSGVWTRIAKTMKVTERIGASKTNRMEAMNKAHWSGKPQLKVKTQSLNADHLVKGDDTEELFII